MMLFSVHLCSFQAIQTQFERSTSLGPQFHSALGDFCPLRRSHRVLRCIPSYTSYQDPAGALIARSPLICYFDVRLPGFLSRGLTVNEARQLGPRQVREDSLKLISEGSVDTVFPTKHIPIEDPVNPEPINDTVQRRNMGLGALVPKRPTCRGSIWPTANPSTDSSPRTPSS